MTYYGQYDYFGLVMKYENENRYLHDIYNNYTSVNRAKDLLGNDTTQIYGLKSILKLNNDKHFNWLIIKHGLEDIDITFSVEVLNRIQYILEENFLNQEVRVFQFIHYDDSIEYFIGEVI